VRFSALLVALMISALTVAGCASLPATSTAIAPLPTLPTAAPLDTPTAIPVAGDTLSSLERLGGEPCPDGDFTCLTLTLPRDHFAPAGPDSPTIGVVFAVLPASGERKGMFVTAVGGPGASGLAAADSYASALDSSIREHFDLVFFDQRGVGASGGLQCASAAATYYRSDAQAKTPEQESASVAAARAFAEACVAETADSSLLPYLSTRQAVEDLEAFREAIGDPKLWLYGESYGTQFAQAYAHAHPDRLAGLILDGTVDVALSGPEFLAQEAQAFNDVLLMTLEACNADPGCAADVGGDAVSTYDSLAARLAEAPVAFAFPLPSGEAVRRFFSLSELETAAAGYLYTESERMLLQRALAAAARDDLAPLARLLYQSLGLDPETLEAIPDPTYSDAVYYAVECLDYAHFSGAPDERARAYLRAGDAVDSGVPRLSSIFYGDLPCAFWPASSQPRTTSILTEAIPTLVLGATADPATPVGNGEQVYRRLPDAYLVTVEGGAHVVFGRGDACVDDVVTAFLARGERPGRRETICPGYVADAYVPLAPLDARDFADPLEALASLEDEIALLPEYYNWDGETPTSVGCPFGGALSFDNADGAQAFRLDGCAYSDGFVVTGAGVYDPDADRFTLDVRVAGLAEGALIYSREGDGSIRVSGEYDGQAVDLSQ
jgi:pimeloyl-ACP methyl ester carboxylesterase